MTQSWKEKLSCATACHRCSQALAGRDRRILSVYDHEPICLGCKAAEERRPDYESVSKEAARTTRACPRKRSGSAWPTRSWPTATPAGTASITSTRSRAENRFHTPRLTPGGCVAGLFELLTT